jgi:hypothetical protein
MWRVVALRGWGSVGRGWPGSSSEDSGGGQAPQLADAAFLPQGCAEGGDQVVGAGSGGGNIEFGPALPQQRRQMHQSTHLPSGLNVTLEENSF